MFVLFITQRLHRIDARRAVGGQPTGKLSCREDQHYDAANCGRISGTDFVKLAFDDLR